MGPGRTRGGRSSEGNGFSQFKCSPIGGGESLMGNTSWHLRSRRISSLATAPTIGLFIGGFIDVAVAVRPVPLFHPPSCLFYKEC